MTPHLVRRSLIVLSMVLGAMVAAPPGGYGHAWDGLYDVRWPVEARPVVWRVSPGIDAAKADFVPFIVKGAEEWNAIGSTMRFQFAGVAENSGFDCESTAVRPSLVRARDLPNVSGRNILAQSQICPPDGPPRAFIMEFDTKEQWFGGAVDPPEGAIDVWAVSSHEFGHATGWGAHYDDDVAVDICDEDNLKKHTMCAGIAASNQRMRTLEDHDIHTFKNSYPRPAVPGPGGGEIQPPGCLTCF